jgi:hypothetical protein
MYLLLWLGSFLFVGVAAVGPVKLGLTCNVSGLNLSGDMCLEVLQDHFCDEIISSCGVSSNLESGAALFSCPLNESEVLESIHFKNLWEFYVHFHSKLIDTDFDIGVRRINFMKSVFNVCAENLIAASENSGLKFVVNEMSDRESEVVEILRHSFKYLPGGVKCCSQQLVGAVNFGMFFCCIFVDCLLFLLVVSAAAVDWRSVGVVGAVRNQLNCGSCYAHAAVSALESHIAIIHNSKPLSLSVQQVVDCSNRKKYGNDGCNGGFIDSVYDYIRDVGGLNLETSYVYNGLDGSCRFNRSVNAKFGYLDRKSPYINIDSCSDRVMELAVSRGPVAVAIDASSVRFLNYRRGIYSDRLCDTGNLNHAVVIVGFGFDAVLHKKFWIVQNSWGASWGDNGYIRILRGVNVNTCGILSLGVVPNVLF